MAVYVVKECVDTHTGEEKMVALFLKKEHALKFVKDNNWHYNAWFSDKPINGMKVEEVRKEKRNGK